ncbi:MAG: hypothetical protein QOC56_925, partial [Alphaproteobacteria bacterium]|nr:hypothetical protein [Alphaproteobacteria bacterium]
MKAQSMGGVAAALLAVAFSFGGSLAVRAENPELAAPGLPDMIIAPIMQAVEGIGERLARVETTVAAFARSIVTTQMTTQQLCISDDAGGQTCITKAQLDALLLMHAQFQTGRAAAATGHTSAPSPAADTSAATEPAATGAVVDQDEITIVAPATLDRAEEPVTAELGQPDEPAGDQPKSNEPSTAEVIVTTGALPDPSAEIIAAGSVQDEDIRPVQTSVVPAERMTATPDASELATLRDTPEDLEELMVTGSISPAGPDGAVTAVPPPDIS